MNRTLAAIIRADFLIRFRRPSTLVLFLLLSALPYLWIPDPSTGGALFRIDRARALYNSAATGMGTAMLATMFIGLTGFYVVSNALARDVRSRCGSVIASTTTPSGTYLFGKFLGNAVFLATFTAGFMLTAMVMQVVRGEAALEPWTFAKQYLLLVPPIIVLVSMMAILFESVPPLSGRIGDVVYFFVWCAVMIGSALLVMKGGSNGWYFDTTGMAFVIDHIHTSQHTMSVSIGAGSFDASRAPVLLTGLPMEARAVAQRLASALLPLVLFPIALLSFHRFNPERVRSAGPGERAGFIAQLNVLVKPLTRRVAAVPLIGGVASDAMLTFAIHPAAAILALAVIAAPIASAATIPVTFAAVALLVADVASREASSGTTALSWAAPHLREWFVAWKFGSSLLLAGVLLAIPLARTAAEHPARVIPMLTGIVLIAAAATSLGILSSNPKTFIVLFLTFWYVVVNDHGATPALDFAGWFGSVPTGAIAVYAAISAGLIGVAAVIHKLKLAHG